MKVYQLIIVLMVILLVLLHLMLHVCLFMENPLTCKIPFHSKCVHIQLQKPSIDIVDTQTNGPVVILVPGLATNISFQSILTNKFIEHGYRAITFGFRKPYKGNQQTRTEDMQHVWEQYVRKHISDKESIHIAAVSYGCIITCRTLLQTPNLVNRISKLIFLNPVINRYDLMCRYVPLYQLIYTRDVSDDVDLLKTWGDIKSEIPTNVIYSRDDMFHDDAAWLHFIKLHQCVKLIPLENVQRYNCWNAHFKPKYDQFSHWIKIVMR